MSATCAACICEFIAEKNNCNCTPYAAAPFALFILFLGAIVAFFIFSYSSFSGYLLILIFASFVVVAVVDCVREALKLN